MQLHKIKAVFTTLEVCTIFFFWFISQFQMLDLYLNLDLKSFL